MNARTLAGIQSGDCFKASFSRIWEEEAGWSPLKKSARNPSFCWGWPSRPTTRKVTSSARRDGCCHDSMCCHWSRPMRRKSSLWGGNWAFILRMVIQVYEGGGWVSSKSSTSNLGSLAIARRSIWSRCWSDAVGLSFLWGDCRQGRKTKRSKDSWSQAFFEMARWPSWIGSKVPPKKQMRGGEDTTTGLADDVALDLDFTQEVALTSFELIHFH